MLNNSPILSRNDITVTRVVTIGDVAVLNLTDVQVTALTNFLNDNDVDVDSVIGVGVLSGGQLVIFQ